MAHTPRKRFGQNFLHDHSIIYNIISSIQAKPDQHWVEIGPGQGALTEPLLKQGVRLEVVELDRDLVALLREKFKQYPNLKIHSADALRFDFSSLVEEDNQSAGSRLAHEAPEGARAGMAHDDQFVGNGLARKAPEGTWAGIARDDQFVGNGLARKAPEGTRAGIARDEKLRVIGNLPYNISTPLMFHLLDNAYCIEDMHFMLQKEVVDRICAAPGSKKYGRLSVMMQYYCSTELLFDVPPESFDPAPQVMSAIVRLVPHRQPPVAVNDIAKLNRVVTQAFSQRRKTLRNSMKKLIAEEEIVALGIDPTLRAENISLAEFAGLSNLLQDL